MASINKATDPRRSILAVGSLAFDSIRTPAGKADRILGGSANYFSISASFFTNLKLVGIVGQDFPREHLDVLSKRGIDLEGLEIAKGETFHWVGEYGTDLNEAKTLSTCLNVFEHFNPKLPGNYVDSRYVFLGNIVPALQRSVYNQLKKPVLVALDSMNFWITGQRESLLETLKIVDLLTINEGEAYLLSEQSNILDAAKTIRKMGPKALIIKRGEYGALLFTDNGIFSAPALPLSTVKDPTGAGDTFAGGVMGYLAHEDAGEAIFKDDSILRRAVIYGSVMASFTVEDFGFTNLLRTTAKAAEERYQQFLKMTRF
ncbi:MAG: bifunctional hydroxymethylpyrimidine kinase/phosphomethylpyrimidine kinase [Deltaproteobacteria bacterium]|nr:bifunctional hydroxymethylpyrimidine kinase/phosphomethylpyrimidine kinase [Deltaproteobacteria bacterium]